MSTVLIEQDGPVWTVTLNRPEVRNAVDGPTARALADAFRRFDADADSCVAVLHGAGDGVADLRPVQRDSPDRAVLLDQHSAHRDFPS